MTIKNGDLPAMPIVDSNGCTSVYGAGRGLSADGMSKRETIAMHIMAQVVGAAMQTGAAREREDADVLAKASVYAVDALLAELERTK